VREIAGPFQTLLEGDQFDLVALVEVDRAAGAMRYALDTHDRTFGGKAYSATAGGFAEVEESAERRLPSLRLVLQNLDGVLGPQLLPAAGGEDVRGRRVTILQVSREFLGQPDTAAYSIRWTFFVDSVGFAGREAVLLELGCFPAEHVLVPGRTTQGLRCVWAYRGEHCGYVGSLETCDRTLDGSNGCTKHFIDEPLRFGGFPGSADFRAGLQV
jgi:phage-related protein